MAGKDCTDAFANYHPASIYRNLLPGFYIGECKDSLDGTEFVKEHRKIRQEVRSRRLSDRLSLQSNSNTRSPPTAPPQGTLRDQQLLLLRQVHLALLPTRRLHLPHPPRPDKTPSPNRRSLHGRLLATTCLHRPRRRPQRYQP